MQDPEQMKKPDLSDLTYNSNTSDVKIVFIGNERAIVSNKALMDTFSILNAGDNPNGTIAYHEKTLNQIEKILTSNNCEISEKIKNAGIVVIPDSNNLAKSEDIANKILNNTPLATIQKVYIIGDSDSTYNETGLHHNAIFINSESIGEMDQFRKAIRAQLNKVTKRSY